MRRIGAVLFAVTLTAVASAHIGSPNVLFDGTAGPYPVRVIVRPPNVVPGLAEVVVRTTAPDVQRIVIQPVFWRTGVAGAPRGDEMSRVAGQSGTFSGQLWLMARGSYSVYVTVYGDQGAGYTIVPVDSFATGRLGLSPGLTAMLVVLGLTLVAGLVTIEDAARTSSPSWPCRCWRSSCSAARNGGTRLMPSIASRCFARRPSIRQSMDVRFVSSSTTRADFARSSAPSYPTTGR